jgi:hypothetical protein
MKIAVLDYSVGEVDIIEAPEMELSEEIENWLEDAGGYRLGDISWMAGVNRVNTYERATVLR